MIQGVEKQMWKQKSLSEYFQIFRHRLYSRLLVFLLLGLLFATGISPVFSQINSIVLEEPQSCQNIVQQVSPNSISPLPSRIHWLEEGKKFYTQQCFDQAIKVWKQAAEMYQVQGDKLYQATSWNYLSLAYQKQGKWLEAEEAIDRSLALLNAEVETSTLPNSTLILAQALNTKGLLELSLGRSEAALENWQYATNLYEQAGDDIGRTGSLINQTQALDALGLYRRACKTSLQILKLDTNCDFLDKNSLALDKLDENPPNSFEEVLRIFQQEADPQIKVLGLRSLGNALRLFGELNKSQEVLQQSLQFRQKNNISADEESATLLSLADTERTLYIRRKELYEINNKSDDRNKAIKKAKTSICYYQEATQKSNNSFTTTSIKAQLNYLSILLNLNKWLNRLGVEDIDDQVGRWIEKEVVDDSILAEEIKECFTKQKLSEINSNKIQVQIEQLLELFNDERDRLSQLLPPIQVVYTQLDFAQILLPISEQYKSIAIESAEYALKKAETIENQRAIAYALGILGNLYEQTNELDKAQRFTKQALFKAQSIQAWDIVYQWQWQLARIYKAKEETKKAIIFYETAIETLDTVRYDLLAIDQDIQFSFRDNVKPVYQELLRLLLRPKASQEDMSQEDMSQEDMSQEDIKRVTKVISSFQLAELENFLRCRNLVSPKEEEADRAKNLPEAVIYPIFLPEQDSYRIGVIVELSQSGKLIYESKDNNLVSQKEVKATINNLQNLLQTKGDLEREIKPQAEKLYQWIIKPIKKYLPESGTLVFIPDIDLPIIPPALLYDGKSKQYLVEQYSVTVSLPSQLPTIQTSDIQTWNVLSAGMFKKSEKFPQLSPLKNVETELEKIKETFPNQVQELANDKFTKEKFQKQISNTHFSLVHLATHGQFSSDPEQTYIYAWDEKIKVQELEKLLKRREEKSLKPIELLVLSACETAEGDKRAALGIAGVALRAKTRSTLASLWQVSDKATAKFMEQFYSNLTKGKMTKAKALQEVQKSLLKDRKYKHPFYWAPFILVGNWL